MVDKRAYPAEIGDSDTPLEVDLGSIDRTHKMVGELAEVAPHARESLRDHRGKRCRIMGVFHKCGQIAGFEIDIEEERFTVPTKDLFTRFQMVEDIHLNSPAAVQVREHMAHWNSTHDYYGPSWRGVERFHYELAKLSSHAGFETRGWYRYPSSTREGMDGKDWRLVLPLDKAVAVNCHSVLHDDVWTLATSIYSTDDIDTSKLTLIGHDDFWTRTLLWSIKVAAMLQTDGYRYEEAISGMTNRLRMIPILRKMMREMVPKVEEAHQMCFGKPSKMPEYISVGVSEAVVPANAAATYRNPSDVLSCGIITLSKSAMKDLGAEVILLHELIHAAIGDDTRESHGKEFRALADMLGVPRKHQD